MLELIVLLFFLAVVLFVVVIVGHVLWLVGAALFRAVFDIEEKRVHPSVPSELRCEICFSQTSHDRDYCGFCGCLRRTALLLDLEASKRTLQRLHKSDRIDLVAYANWKECLDAEFVRLNDPEPSHSYQPQPQYQSGDEQPHFKESTPDSLVVEIFEPEPSFFSNESEAVPPEPVVTKPRRRFSDMLNSFMEESNIR